ncbi:UPF0158 family protein [Gordonia amicalis]|uniref:UPF0158 family protein n=1 Tax=Gordonia amicalis TaxID=89053 RepID=UPI0022A6B4C9|nr:UPF0158 family protein [Gordonia amicalis]MCZ0912379.1 UPF0158 family protein [Gordonia amicalis]
MTIELLGGRGQDLWPCPGRIFAVGPSHTFADLANAVNTAFARWDLAHLSMFTLDDGRVVTDPELGDDLMVGGPGPLSEALDIDSAKVHRLVKPGAEFQYTFDLGDDWTHRCVVAPEKIDPTETLGGSPRAPLPYQGWGDIPDQYGRRWSDDDGESPVPARPHEPHPMLTGDWPDRRQPVPELGLRELRTVIRDADRFLDTVSGRDIDDILQHVGAGIPAALKNRRERTEPVAASIIERLRRRGDAGDAELADDLLACLRGEPLPGREASVDLEMLSDAMEGDPSQSTGGYIDLETGLAYDDEMMGLMDPDQLGIDEDDLDPDRFIRYDCTGSREGWQDMADFAVRQRDPKVRERLERAIEGRGAFRRFRDAVHELALNDQWYAFSTDRKMGRAREFLATEGIRVTAEKD